MSMKLDKKNVEVLEEHVDVIKDNTPSKNDNLRASKCLLVQSA
jgi:hypothetical protein